LVVQDVVEEAAELAAKIKITTSAFEQQGLDATPSSRLCFAASFVQL
jgi:hypothetical protein